MIRKDILRAFHELFEPFDSRWLLDCTTEKVCEVEGEERRFLDPKEPIYLTSRILRKAMEKYDKGETGDQRATLIAATRQFMNFIELKFSDKLSVYGRKPLEGVVTYHIAVKAFIEGTKTWRVCHKEKDNTRQKNKVLKDFMHPNYEAEVLEEFKRYIVSEDRLNGIKKVINLAKPNAPKASDKEFTECGQICMGEIVISTGCRPVVVYRLPNFEYFNKKPGFNPLKVTAEDRIINEEEEGDKIYRRLDPNLPPKHLACQHQLEQRTAICPVNCDERCDPEGFNILVYWDKTSEKMGTSYLHLAKTLKDLLDLYVLVKKKFCSGRKSKKNGQEWIDDENTPFFRNSSGSSFCSVNLKHISAAMRIDVSAYAFRRIVSTWALSHKLEEIRQAETEALQHSLTVATGAYQQNKQIKPQVLTQTYVEEEGLYPKEFHREMKEIEASSRKLIIDNEEKQLKKQQESRVKEKESLKMLQLQHKPLGPRHMVMGTDRNQFKRLVCQIAGENTLIDLKSRNPKQWRNFFVRLVCSTVGDLGEQIREVWTKVYRGDLRFGVRDVRWKSKAKNWPRKNCTFTRNRDRNSWIAGGLLRSLQKEKETKDA